MSGTDVKTKERVAKIVRELVDRCAKAEGFEGGVRASDWDIDWSDIINRILAALGSGEEPVAWGVKKVDHIVAYYSDRATAQEHVDWFNNLDRVIIASLAPLYAHPPADQITSGCRQPVFTPGIHLRYCKVGRFVDQAF